jgi:predicted AAA+ superfamily ATPase
MNLQSTLLEQNPHWDKNKKIDNYVYRDIINDFNLQSDFIEVITGVRRSGKSTIFNILINDLIKKAKVKPYEILMLNFDNPGFIPFYRNVQKMDAIIEEAEILIGHKIQYLFLDEVQNIESWEKWLKAKYDQKVFKKIFVTGSNANLLEGQYISRLSGRYFSYINYPFSFKEFLDFKKIKYYKNIAENFSVKQSLINQFNKYFETGGFPEFVIANNLKILETYYQTVILKDVISNNRINDTVAMKEIAYYLLSNTSNLFSYNNIAKNLNIHEQTVKEYIEHLKQAFLFYELKKYDYSVKKQNKNKKKIYCVDNGFVNKIGFSFSENRGKYLENLIFTELQRKGKEVFYYSDKYECDFVVKKGNKINEAIQACYEVNDKNKSREYGGLIEVMNEFKLKKGLIITYKQRDAIVLDNKRIILKPAWEWLLV